MNKIEKILFLAKIRKFLNENFSDEDIQNGIYFDVVEKIILPSEEGEFSEFDAVAMVNKQQKKWIQSIIVDVPVTMGYVCI